MKNKISALMDGELDARELRDVCMSFRHDGELRRTCSTYALIGDALRQESYLPTEITGAVLDRLADEPVVLAPRRGAGIASVASIWRDHKECHRPVLAMAATLAGVAVVGWFGLTTQSAQQMPLGQLAQSTSSHEQAVVMASAATADADMQEYLIAHQTQSGLIYLNGEAQHIRTVSMNGAELPR